MPHVIDALNAESHSDAWNILYTRCPKARRDAERKRVLDEVKNKGGGAIDMGNINEGGHWMPLAPLRADFPAPHHSNPTTTGTSILFHRSTCTA